MIFNKNSYFIDFDTYIEQISNQDNNKKKIQSAASNENLVFIIIKNERLVLDILTITNNIDHYVL